MRTICVVIGSRANYSSIRSAMHAIQAHELLKLQVVVGASAVLDRYGSVNKLIQQDGFNIDAQVHMLIEGETPTTMAKSTGLGLIELSTVFTQLKPDIVITVGDRFETMATTLAAAYMNIPIAHTMGGEVSGTIDESIRHAVTKFSHIHFPASLDAKYRILKLGENPDHVHHVGCPRLDLVDKIISTDHPISATALFSQGVGNTFNLDEPFLLVSQHPVTTEYGQGEFRIGETLEAIKRAGLPAIILWPNADAGSADIARGIRKWREQQGKGAWYFVKNLPMEDYVRLMKKTACLVGNSSSGIREGAFIGTPVVNVGSRQFRRQRGANVIDAPHSTEEIFDAISQQLNHGHYTSDPIYGDGTAGQQIADILAHTDIALQKAIYY